jgi:CubicO group peptidase (beta-lactamase class C family)
VRGNSSLGVNARLRAVTVPISGKCSAEFGAVREEFTSNFTDRGEVGAAVCVIVDNEVVVDLVGGWADASQQRLWQAGTIVDFYSVGKALVALLALQLVDAGLMRLDEPIATYWPEFAAGGKATATVRHALCHRAGVPAIREPLTNEDLWQWDKMAGALAATDAWFVPGSRHVYHTNTYGHLVGELIRRVTSEMPGSRLRDLAGGVDADVWVGVPPSEQHRCADIIWAAPAIPAEMQLDDTSPEALMIALGYRNPPGYSSMGVVNSAEWRAAQVPSTNGHGTAKGVARIYSALLEPDRLLSASLLAEATSAQSEGYCPVLGEETTFGLGFKPTSSRRPFGPNPRSFGHFGTGGAVGFADPDRGVAFGYVMNHVIPRWQSTRNRALIGAVYRSL